MIDQVINVADVEDLVLLLIVFVIYKVDIRSKNNRLIDRYVIVSLTIIAVFYILLRAYFIKWG